MLCEGAMAQYATCELARHEVTTATWAVEENNHWRQFLDHSLAHLKRKHQYSQTDLKIWQQACTTRGLKDLHQDITFHEYTATQNTLTLAALQEQACQLKEYVEERGVDEEVSCHIPYIHASLPDFGIQIRSGPILRSASDLIYNKLPKFISYSFNVITAYSFIQ